MTCFGRSFFRMLAQGHARYCVSIQTVYLNSVLEEDGVGPELMNGEIRSRHIFFLPRVGFVPGGRVTISSADSRRSTMSPRYVTGDHL